MSMPRATHETFRVALSVTAPDWMQCRHPTRDDWEEEILASTSGDTTRHCKGRPLPCALSQTTVAVIVLGDRGPIPQKDLLTQNINLFMVTVDQCQEMRRAEEVAKGLEEDLEVTDGWFC